MGEYKERFLLVPDHNSALRPLKPHQVSLKLSREFSRQAVDETQEEEIEKRWRDKLSVQPKLFNGIKFRLHSVEWLEEPEEGISFKVEMGITDYKSFLGTHYIPAEQRQRLIQLGNEKYGDSRRYFSMSLGVESVLETGDGLLAFIRRSQYVAVARGKMDMVGGHPEPVEFCQRYIESHLLDLKLESKLEEGSIEEVYRICDRYQSERKEGDSNLLVEELFEASAREIHDELGIPMKDLAPPLLLGVVYNEAMGGKPDFVFLIRTGLTSTEVKRIYDAGTHAEAYETDGLMFLTREQIVDLKFPTTSDDFEDDQRQDAAIAASTAGEVPKPDSKVNAFSFAVAAEAGIALYQRVLEKDAATAAAVPAASN